MSIALDEDEIAVFSSLYPTLLLFINGVAALFPKTVRKARRGSTPAKSALSSFVVDPYGQVLCNLSSDRPKMFVIVKNLATNRMRKTHSSKLHVVDAAASEYQVFNPKDYSKFPKLQHYGEIYGENMILNYILAASGTRNVFFLFSSCCNSHS